MQDIMNMIGQFLPLDMNTLTVSVATGIAMALVLALKAGFALLRKLTRSTTTTVDDQIVDKAEEIFKDKSRDI